MMKLSYSINKMKKQGYIPVIAEIKRLIPRLGGNPDTRDADELAKAYTRGGAAAVSIVTEKRYFGGRPEVDIPTILRATDIPLLIKDFIETEESIDYYLSIIRESVGPEELSRICFLLITCRLRRLGDDQLSELLNYIHNQGMEALVEVRSVEEIKYVRQFDPKLIGINNKEIENLEREKDSTGRAIRLIRKCRNILKPPTIVIGESGYRFPYQLVESVNKGINGFLIGTVFMRSNDPEQEVRNFVTGHTPTKVQISCIQTLADVKMLIEEGVDSIEFIVDPKQDVPCGISSQKASELTVKVRDLAEDQISVVLATDRTDITNLKNMIGKAKPSRIQLHGFLEPNEVKKLRKCIDEDTELVVMLHVKGHKIVHKKGDKRISYDPVKLAKEYVKIDGIMIGADTFKNDKVGCTGKIHDHVLSKKIRDSVHPIPFTLAGGLNPKNVRVAVTEIKPETVTVYSGVTTQRRLDRNKIRQFINEVRSAATGVKE